MAERRGRYDDEPDRPSGQSSTPERPDPQIQLGRTRLGHPRPGSHRP